MGYADKHDEWREVEEVESICEEAERYTQVIMATSSSNALRQALGSKQAQERRGSSSTKKYCMVNT